MSELQDIKIRKLKRKDLTLITNLVESSGLTVSELIDMIWPKNNELIRTITSEQREAFKSQIGEQLDEFLEMPVSKQDAIILKAISKKETSDRMFGVVRNIANQVDSFADNLDELLSSVCDIPVGDIQDLDLDIYFRLIMKLIEGAVGKN